MKTIIILLITTLLVGLACTKQEPISKEATKLTTKLQKQGYDYDKFYPENVVSYNRTATVLDGEAVCSMKYINNHETIIVSMDEDTFFKLEDLMGRLENVKQHSTLWKSINEQTEFIIFYKNNTNLLLIVDKD